MRQLPGKDGPRETGRLVSDPRCLDYAASGQVAGALYSYQAWWQEPAYLPTATNCLSQSMSSFALFGETASTVRRKTGSVPENRNSTQLSFSRYSLVPSMCETLPTGEEPAWLPGASRNARGRAMRISGVAGKVSAAPYSLPVRPYTVWRNCEIFLPVRASISTARAEAKMPSLPRMWPRMVSPPDDSPPSSALCSTIVETMCLNPTGTS